MTAENRIALKGGNYYIPQVEQDAVRVLSGSALVYIVPWQDDHIGRRAFLHEAVPGEIIPAFVHRDRNYQHWRFCLVASEQVELEILPGVVTNPLKKKFAQRICLSAYDKEGFESALVDRYRRKLAEEDGFLIRSAQERVENIDRTDRLIASVLNHARVDKDDHEIQSPLYQVLAVLCKKGKLPLAAYEAITSCCGDDFSVQDAARISHFPCREVVLEENWYRTDAGLLLVHFGKDEEPAACVPRGTHGYNLYRAGEKKVRLTRHLAEQCQPKAVMLYRPFPQKTVTPRDLAKFCLQSIRPSDLMLLLAMTVVSSLIGLLLPTLNQVLYDSLIPTGHENAILQLGCLICSFMVGNILFSIVSSLSSFRLTCRIEYEIQSAAYHRMFELPERFFRQYESADMAKRVMELGGLVSQVVELAVSLTLTIVSAFFYFWRMLSYSVTLSVAGVLMMAAYSIITYVLALRQLVYQKEIVKLDGKSASVMYQFISGISKLRIAGVEDRAIYEYMKPFARERQLSLTSNRLSYYSSTLSTVIGSIISIMLYALAYAIPSITVGTFVAFTSALGMVSGAITGLAGALVSCKMLGPIYARARPILDAEPESTFGNLMPSKLTGRIDADHLAFAYSEDGPSVLRDLTVHIAAGEYVGIVGTSGCGKSTLLKLFLGFERPKSGKIYYDNQDIESLNLQELRKHFGVVLQDGGLISGSIFENITITAPNATIADVEQVIEQVGLASDIKEMPMGLQTMLSENCGTISGGQQQRILIARAIINKPDIIFFDEATSALDNVTQAMVCDTLEQLGSTRIVIAHRLSTIQRCDRILVMKDGTIAEQGNYQNLIEQKGLFYELAQRQLLNIG